MVRLADSASRRLSVPPLPVVFDTRVVTGSGGGPDKTILNSPRFLTGLGYRMLCGYLTPPNDPGYAEIERKAAKYEAPLVTIADRGPWDWRVITRLLTICRSENVRIWHGHDYKTNALGLILQRFWPMRLVTTLHGWVHHTTRTPLYYKIDQLCLPRYEKVFCVSPDLLDAARKARVRPENNILLENGIDTEEYTRRQTPHQARESLRLPPGGQLVMAAGRLEPEKGFDLLIRAVAELQTRYDLRLVIIGEGHDRPRLEGLIRDLNLGSRVTLAGWQSDVKPYYEAADVFALSSLREGLPNVLLEAMALETPCVATRIAGIPRLIQSGENGLLIEAGDQAGLTNALEQLLANADLRHRLRTAARQTILTRYSFAERMRKLARVYDEMLPTRSQSRGMIV
jgi:glycosyltransferase involved in cell wall biosynthesis